jgi:hypothetical protein
MTEQSIKGLPGSFEGFNWLYSIFKAVKNF